jgi:hypothetical protein
MKKTIAITLSVLSKKGKKQRDVFELIADEGGFSAGDFGIDELTEIQKIRALAALGMLGFELQSRLQQPMPQMQINGCECSKCKPRS